MNCLVVNGCWPHFLKVILMACTGILLFGCEESGGGKAATASSRPANTERLMDVAGMKVRFCMINDVALFGGPFGVSFEITPGDRFCSFPGTGVLGAEAWDKNSRRARVWRVVVQGVRDEEAGVIRIKAEDALHTSELLGAGGEGLDVGKYTLNVEVEFEGVEKIGVKGVPIWVSTVDGGRPYK